MLKIFLLPVLSLCITACSSSDTSGKKEDSTQLLRISTLSDPQSLDTRIGRDLNSANAYRMLYEGLLRVGNKGQLAPGIAESIELSPDQKVYTFKLRESVWSNGDKLTAKDFEETWKSMLVPSFPAPNANQLFAIKGAKDFKEGKGEMQNIGITAPDEHTLIVELDAPCPYFLRLVASHFYSPIHSSLRQEQSQKSSENSLVSNGPFKLSQWKRNNELVLIKNPQYWDSKTVRLDAIALNVLDESTAYQLFETGQLEWAGSPLSTVPQDAVAHLRSNNQLNMTQGAGVHWLRINIEAAPLNNTKMRRALSLAINRQEIVDHITQGGQKPALELIPPILKDSGHPYYKDHDLQTAWSLYQEALEEMKIDKDQLPAITLNYPATDREHKIAQAIQQQWKKGLGIDVSLQANEVKTHVEKVKSGNYQIAFGSWYADFEDPINFLEIFKYKTNSANSTRWENQHFIELLNASEKESDPAKRLDILSKAEGLLLEEMPVAPLFFGTFNYLKSPQVQGSFLSPMGILDFKYTFLGPSDSLDLNAPEDD